MKILHARKAKKSVHLHRINKRSELTSLLETVLKVLSFLLFLFLAFYDFAWVSFPIGLGTRVCDTDVKDVIGSSSLETAYQEIPPLFLRATS
jgi:hypothetical protein